MLFLQNLQLKAGTSAVLEGVAFGLAATCVGAVLVVMTGGTALSFQDLGWIPRHATPFTLPGWMGAWFEMYSTLESAQRTGSRNVGC